ncbi:MAG: S-layer homology domain-containing protein, partial [Actinomyces sp.]
MPASTTSSIPIRRLVGAVALVAALGAGAVPAGAYGGFQDVRADRYHADAVAWMADRGITTGIRPGCFFPGASATRAEMVTFLWRYAGQPAGGSHPFADVTAAWQQQPVAWAYRNGITTGVGGAHFAPDRPVTRGEVATFLWRYAGRPATAPRPDVTCSVALGLGSANTGIEGARAAGLFSGSLRTYHDLDITDAWLAEHNGGSRIAEGIEVTGGLHVSADDVTIRYAWIHDYDGTLGYAVSNVASQGEGHGNDLRLEWVTIDASGTDTKAFAGWNFTIHRSEIIGGEDGIHMTHDQLATSDNDYGIITETFVHSQTHAPGQHSDTIQIWSRGTLTVTDSRLIAPYHDQNATLQASDAREITVARNYLFGGALIYNGAPAGTLHSHDNLIAYDSSLYGVYYPDADTDARGDLWWSWQGDIPLAQPDGTPY